MIVQALVSLESGSKKDEPSNLTLLLDKLLLINSTSELRKKIIIDGMLHIGKTNSVLKEAVNNPVALRKIIDLLKKVGCFGSECSRDKLINAILAPDVLEISVLGMVATKNEQTVKILHQALKDAGCFSNAENRQKLIDNLLKPSMSDEGMKIWKAHRWEGQASNAAIIAMLKDAGCFDGPLGSPNQQKFVDFLFVKNSSGTCRFDALSIQRLGVFLKQLSKIQYFKGPDGPRNQQLFINAVLSTSNHGNDSWLLRSCRVPLFDLLIEQLNKANCFSGAGDTVNKQALIKAVFTKDKRGGNVLTRVNFSSESAVQLLKLLSQTGCFSAKNLKARYEFIKTIRRDGNRILFHAMGDLNSYLALRACLFEAGLSTEDFKGLLNEPASHEYCRLKNTTPLMSAMLESKKDELLIDRLKHDGATLTDEQAVALAEYENSHHRKSKAEKLFNLPAKLAEIKRRLTKPSTVLSRQTDGEDNAPLKTDFLDEHSSLFFKKTAQDDRLTVDDLALLKQSANGWG